MHRRRFLALCGATALAGCGADPTFDAPEEVAIARFVSPEPPSITLIIGINARNGSGAHAALIVNASQRVLFDPAGTFEHPDAPIQHDVHFGMSDRMVSVFIDYHTRDSAKEEYYVFEHTLQLPAATAELILQKVQAYGPVPKAQCTKSISEILRSVPGFESLPSTWFPKAFGEAFAQLPGVRSRKITEATSDKSHGVVMLNEDGEQVN